MNKKIVGIKLKRQRMSKNMTQSELSEKSGVSVYSIRKYEAGEREPKIEALAQIAAALNVDITALTAVDEDDPFFHESKDYLDKALQKSLLFYFDQMNNVGKRCSIDVVQRLAATGPLRKDYVDPFKELENAFNSDPEGSE